MYMSKFNIFVNDITSLKNSTPLKTNGVAESDRVFLLDYGLASKYLLSNGEHKEFCPDQRRAHAGTVLFCSRDAHKGVLSRRSDLESLAYNIVYWLTGSLPWIEDLEQPLDVEKKKNRCFSNLKSFLELSFNSDFPSFVLEYCEYLNRLQFEENPDYDFCRKIFKKAMKTYGYKDDTILDFDNVQGWGIKKKKQVPARNNVRLITCGSFLKTSPLMPLHSNIVFRRPKLRKKAKTNNNNNNDLKIPDTMMNWSKILTDPETIIKQARERKTTEGSDQGVASLSFSDIESMNPTYAMMEIYNRCKDRETSPRYKGESYVPDNLEGYTPAMMSVYTKMMEKKELESCSDSNNQSDNEVNVKVQKRTRNRRRRGSESPTLQRNFRTKSQPHGNNFMF
nr:casein kinase I homolog 3-like [Leptinotarsa decemlineata]